MNSFVKDQGIELTVLNKIASNWFYKYMFLVITVPIFNMTLFWVCTLFFFGFGLSIPYALMYGLYPDSLHMFVFGGTALLLVMGVFTFWCFSFIGRFEYEESFQTIFTEKNVLGVMVGWMLSFFVIPLIFTMGILLYQDVVDVINRWGL